MNYDEECFYLYAKLLEEGVKKSYKKPSDKELLIIFPEAKKIIINKISEWEEKKRLQENIINLKLSFVKKIIATDFTYWFFIKWIECTDGEKLKEINHHLIRLKHQRYINSNKSNRPNHLNQDQIDSVLNIPFKDVAKKYVLLKKLGRLYIGLCPFHNEKNPSFYIYPDTNSFYCYGCQKGGNIITFLKLIEGYSFKQAVDLLLNIKN